LSKQDKATKRAVSMCESLATYADSQARKYHQGNFSAYIASLVIKDREEKGNTKEAEKPVIIKTEDDNFIDGIMNGVK
jgi:hypothetical protein